MGEKKKKNLGGGGEESENGFRYWFEGGQKFKKTKLADTKKDWVLNHSIVYKRNERGTCLFLSL